MPTQLDMYKARQAEIVREYSGKIIKEYTLRFRSRAIFRQECAV
jgi:hypothetical protein